MKKFNVNGICYPDKHYMADLRERLEKIEALIDEGDYFVINRARQFGKTTTLWALSEHLREKYLVVFMNFQQLSEADYRDEYAFASAFADLFLEAYDEKPQNGEVLEPLVFLRETAERADGKTGLRRLFKVLSNLCAQVSKRVVLMIDEVDQASNNQVFLDFLAQLRAYYLNRSRGGNFWSVVLAGVYDIKNLKLKIRPDSEHQYNSPWNIAADFKIEMSLSRMDIAGMLKEYEEDHHTGMDILAIAGMIYDYTSGYPFLVSRLCKIMDENISGKAGFEDSSSVWTRDGVTEAVKELLIESNTLFDDLVKKLRDFPELKKMLYVILFNGERITYNIDNHAINIGCMLGFVKNAGGVLVVSNRIFETRLYNMFLSEGVLDSKLYKAADREKNQFIQNGLLNMELVLERFVEAFTDIYADADEAFLEENGRRFFLLYLKPIINGVGNYYIEARTRDMRRTDIIIDYCGKQYVCEMKLWHGEEYHQRGEKQLIGYLEDYHLSTGYMVSFNFNKNKKTGIRKKQIDGKLLIEAVV